jgi:hypothetical protein
MGVDPVECFGELAVSTFRDRSITVSAAGRELLQTSRGFPDPVLALVPDLEAEAELVVQGRVVLVRAFGPGFGHGHCHAFDVAFG